MSSLLRPMIGMPGKNGRGTIELFGEDDAGEAVRHGHGAEGEDEGSTVPCRLVMAIGATDEKRQSSRAMVALAADEGCKGLAVQGYAALVENDAAVGRGSGKEAPGFFGFACIGETGAALGELDELYRRHSEFRAERDALKADAERGRNWTLLAFRAMDEAARVIRTVYGDCSDEREQLKALIVKLDDLAFHVPSLLGMQYADVESAAIDRARAAQKE